MQFFDTLPYPVSPIGALAVLYLSLSKGVQVIDALCVVIFG
jgi:hypothetical protein